MFNLTLILFGKLILLISKTFNLGSGSTWPGHIALLINKNFTKEVINNNKHIKIILIAGTNGKTTTSKLVKHILEKDGKKVFLNETGANLLNGISSCLIKNSDFKGNLDFDIAIFESDENTLPLVLKELNPFGIAILNLFRDQLDRYGEVNTIAIKWAEALKKLGSSCSVFLNGDDPQLYYIGKNIYSKVYFFGMDEKLMQKKEVPHDVDSIYCPKCNSKLIFKNISFSHLGNYKCIKCDFKKENVKTFSNYKIKYSLFGKYNIYNINSAILLTLTLFNIPVDKTSEYLSDFKPAFGRQEIIRFSNKQLMVLLSKNPTGFNQSIEAVKEFHLKKNILIVLNDRIPDGRDISWIWDVDFEILQDLNGLIYISGDRTYDLAIRLKYAGFKEDVLKIYTSLKEATETAIKETKQNEILYILPTYSAMLEIRKILHGKKFHNL